MYHQLKVREEGTERVGWEKQRDQTQNMWGFAKNVLHLKFWKNHIAEGRIKPRVMI